MSTLGIIHTVIGVIAVIAGIIALVRARRITSENATGQVYLWGTVLTCLTGFGIFNQGGFNVAHVLGIITLVVLGIAWMAENKGWFGGGAKLVETLGYTLTLFFHFVPGITETSTRLPVGAPLIASRESPVLQGIIGTVFLIFIIIMVTQVRALRKRGRSA
jgi:hypothetical protein